MRAEWRCATTAHMEQCVMTNGMYWMQQLSADSWDTTQQVGLELYGSMIVYVYAHTFQIIHFQLWWQ